MGIGSKIYGRLRSFLLFHSMLFINYILLICYLNETSCDPVKMTSLISSYILTGVSAFLVNDYYDKEVDQKAGKINLTQSLSSYLIGSIILISFAISFVLIYSISLYASILILTQFLALLAYSHPLIRLKTKPIYGVITDSIYAYVIPLLLLFVVYEVNIREAKYLIFLLFNFSIGIRDILLHQEKDELNDVKSGINSFAIQYKKNLNTTISLFEIIANFSIATFFILVFWNTSSYFAIAILIFYISLLFFQIFKTKNSIENNYLMRFYIVASSIIIIHRLVNSNEYAYLILLVHPYFLQFFLELLIRIKNMIAVIVNYLLYYAFKLVGRNLKEKPLYRKKD
jgi:hypothetical protein